MRKEEMKGKKEDTATVANENDGGDDDDKNKGNDTKDKGKGRQDRGKRAGGSEQGFGDSNPTGSTVKEQVMENPKPEVKENNAS